MARTNRSAHLPSSFLTAGALALGAVALSACGADFEYSFGGEDGTGTVTTRAIEVDDFDAIEVDGILDVDISVEPGADTSVSMTTNPNLFDNLTATSADGTLRLDFKNVGQADSRTVTIVVDDLASVDVDGLASVNISGLHSNVDFDIDGAAELTAQSNPDSAVDEVTLTVSGAADANLTGLPAGVVVLDIDGAANAEIAASQTVTGSVDGAATVEVIGGAQIDVDTSGFASIG